MKDRIHFCIDIGSLRKKKGKSNFGWYCRHPQFKSKNFQSFEDLVEALKELLRDPEAKLSIGVEAPLFFQIHQKPENLNSKRWFEGSKAISSSAGASVTITGLMQLRGLFSALQDPNNPASLKRGEVAFAIDKQDLTETKGPMLLIWEAFVSNKLKPPSSGDLVTTEHATTGGHQVVYFERSPVRLLKLSEHVRDAASAIEALKAERSSNYRSPAGLKFHNLLFSVLVEHGLIESSAITTPCLVVMTNKPKDN